MNKENILIIDLKKGSNLEGYTCNNKGLKWLDIPLIKNEIQVSSKDIFFIELNSLSNVNEIQVCTKYFDVYKCVEGDLDVNGKCNYTRIYESFPSWNSDIKNIKEFSKLPVLAKDFIKYIEDLLDKKIEYISVGNSKDNILRR